MGWSGRAPARPAIEARQMPDTNVERNVRSAIIDGREMTLWVDVVEKGLVIFGEQ